MAQLCGEKGVPMKAISATIVLVISACLQAAADQGSVQELQAKKASAQAVLDKLERDSDSVSAENDRLQRNRPRMQSQYDPSQIDLSVQQATQALQIEIDLQTLFLNYLTTCVGTLGQLPELSPYLRRLDDATRSLQVSTEAVMNNERQQMSIQRQLQSAYHANDARQWNSLNSQYESVQSAEQQLAANIEPDKSAAKSAITDAKSFLRNRIDSLNEDIARASAAEAERAKAATATPPPAPTKVPTWAGSVTPYLESHSSNIPLSFLLGWIATESEGNLHAPATKLNERGYFQIHPEEWCYLQERTQRAHCLQSVSAKGAKTAFTDPVLERVFEKLSTDQEYSLQTGIRYIEMNERNIRGLNLHCDQTTNPDLFWHLVKLNHSTNYKAVEVLIQDMKKNSVAPDSWQAISDYVHVKANRERLTSETHHDLVAGIENVDKVFKSGATLSGGPAR
jgi:hypothetical protein